LTDKKPKETPNQQKTIVSVYPLCFNWTNVSFALRIRNL